MSEWLAEFSRQYFVPLEDYRRDGDWLLVSSGCGIMLALMDAEPRFRWCVDVDAVKNKTRLTRWAAWAECFVGRVVIVGWFSLTDPGAVRRVVEGLKVPPLTYAPFTGIGGVECRTLEELLGILRTSGDTRPNRR